MKYIAVIGTDPEQHRTSHIFKYFDDYLISMGDPTTSKGWTIRNVENHARHIIKKGKKFKENLYIDSGGFQIIVGYITQDRIQEYIDVFHHIVEKYCDDIHKIFSLDVNNQNFSHKEILQFNQSSILQSIELIKRKPIVADKLLFVLQTRNTEVFTIWKNMIRTFEVYKYFKNWSFGGLVGLKKETNAKFSHVVPSTMWLLTYQKHFNFAIEQIHFLGQGSRLNFVMVGILEKMFKLNITCDSSQLVRFAPVSQKMPFIYVGDYTREKIDKEDFDNIGREEFQMVVENESDELMETMFHEENYSKDIFYKAIEHLKYGDFSYLSNLTDIKGFEEFGPFMDMYKVDDFDGIKRRASFVTEPDEIHRKFKEEKKMSSTHLIEMMCMATRNDMYFGKYVANEILKHDINTITLNDITNIHSILNRGQIAVEIFNNINFIRYMLPIMERADIDMADNLMLNVVNDYRK